jgi:hypothetical protein
MNSPFALLLLAIQQRIDAVTVKKAVDVEPEKALNWIDQDLGQLEYHNGDNRPPVSWPACTVDIDSSGFNDIGENAQTGDIGIIIRIGFPPFSSSDLKTPAKYRNKALFYYDIEQAVHLSMQGWAPAEVIVEPATQDVEAVTADISNIFGPFSRRSARSEDRSDLIRVRAITYKSSMEDYSTTPETATTPATIELTTELSFPDDEDEDQ